MFDLIQSNLFNTISFILSPLLAAYLVYFDDYKLRYKLVPSLNDKYEFLIVLIVIYFGLLLISFVSKYIRRVLNKPPKLDWWQTEIIYQIYIKSFNDSNHDGYGDMRGIIEKLDYLRSIGVGTIWLTPCYPSGGKDGGYDVSSFVDIDPIYGDMKDFDDLVEEVHKRGMHILLDFIPNHTSNLHKWFQESSKDDDPNNPYRDYYVWYPSEDKVNPPNNWKSCFGGSAWTYNENRKAWYLHQFLAEQPDLNLRCPAVKKELENVIRFWIDTKKVDGFRVDAVKHLYESTDFKDENLLVPSKFDDIYDPRITYDDLDHTHTSNLVETYQTLYEWRTIFNEIGKRTNSTRALIVEATYDVEDIGSYYWFENNPNAHFAFNFQFCFIGQNLYKKNEINNNNDDENNKTEYEAPVNKPFEPKWIKKLIEEYHTFLPDGCWSNWQLGNHDNRRAASRVGEDNVNIANALNLLIGGTAVIYNGEEIGMQDLPDRCLKFEDCQDERGRKYGPDEYLNQTRDFERTPMQWSVSKNAGFSNSDKTWLPVNPNYKELNVEKQLQDQNSHLKIFKDLVQLRQAPSFQWGTFKIALVNDQIFSFTRKAFGFPGFVVLMNISYSINFVNLSKGYDIPSKAKVTYYISGSVKYRIIERVADLDIKYKYNSLVSTKDLVLNPRDCLILSFPSTN